uniref:Annexin, putative n=2 Tax=Schistosoma mansoni TaxID=6183 RepID=A0A5K4F7B6_SCHMA
MMLDLFNRLFYILLEILRMIFQLHNEPTPQFINATTDYITTEGIISQTENVTHSMLTVEDVYRIGNETKQTTLKIIQLHNEPTPQLMNSTTDYITTEGIISLTEIVTHPMLIVEDIYRIGNETKQTTLKIIQSYDKQIPTFIRSPLNHIDLQGNVYQPKIVPSNKFCASNDVHNIRNQIKKQNYERVLQILLTRTNAQRQHIVDHYKTFEMSLIKEMENIKPNNLKLLIEDLLTDISILFAEELYKAISTSNIQITTSLLIDLWGDEFDQVKNVYKLYSNESIWKSIEERFGKPTEDFLQCVVETRKVKIKQATNEDTFGKPIVNMSEVNKTFHYLLKQKNSTNITEQQLSNLLCKLNPFQLEALDMMYQQDLKRTFFEVIKRRSSGQMHDLLLSLYTYSVNKPMYFATLFHDVLPKELVSVLTAQRLLIFRSEVDLQLVCDIYEALYGTYLSDDVKQKYFGKQDNALTNLLKSEETTVVY